MASLQRIRTHAKPCSSSTFACHVSTWNCSTYFSTRCHGFVVQSQSQKAKQFKVRYKPTPFQDVPQALKAKAHTNRSLQKRILFQSTTQYVGRIKLHALYFPRHDHISQASGLSSACLGRAWTIECCPAYAVKLLPIFHAAKPPTQEPGATQFPT